MAFSTFTGSLTVPAATGNKATTGVGFQPLVVLFWGNGQSADAAISDNSKLGIFWGRAVSSTKRDAMTNSDDGTGSTAVSVDTTKCIKRITGATTTYAADFVSMDADGFTVNFTTANATAFVINFLALGGADITNANIVSFTSGASTGNQATTGMGFNPDAVYFYGVDTSASNRSNVYGLGVSSTSRGTNAYAGNATTGGRIQKTNKVYCNIDGGSSIRCEADLVSLDSDGFTLNWTTANANTHTIFALGLKGGSYAVKAFTQKTSTGSQATTGVGFAPKGLLYYSTGQTAGAGLDGGGTLYQMTGAGSSSTSRGALLYSSGNFPGDVLNRTKIYLAYADDGTPTAQGIADLTSLDSDGFTLNYTTADATAREVLYLAMGNAAAAFVDVIPPMLAAAKGPRVQNVMY